MRYRVSLFLCGILLLGACKSPELIVERVRPYQRSDVAGAWFGFAQADLYLYRLVLRLPNDGLIAYSSPFADTPRVLAVNSWDVEGLNALSVELPSNPHLERIEGRLVSSGVLIATLLGSDGWSNSITFYREDPFETRMQELKAEMQHQNGR